MDALTQLAQSIRNRGYKKIGLVIDHNLLSHPLCEQTLESLGQISDIREEAVTIAEPTYSYLDEFRKNFMETGIEAVVGIGGGSALDVAKAVAVLVNNKNPSVDYRGFDRMTEPVLPVYTVPTTAGTGSEITPNASFVDKSTNKKLGINGEAIRPREAFLHPGFIKTCPEKPAVYAAIDALVHAIEAFAARKATMMSRMFSREAVSLLLPNIKASAIDKNEAAIEKVFMGSLLAGMAMMHSGTGPAAALSYPLGVHLDVPHGLAGGIFLPQIMHLNVKRGYYGYADMVPHPKDSDDSGKQDALRVAMRISQLWNDLGIPDSAALLGFSAEHLEIFMSDLEELRGAIDQNPVELSAEDLMEILRTNL